MKEKTIVSAMTLFASLATYLYAKHAEKDAVPYVMLGGFVGSLIGEVLAKTFSKDDDDDSGSASSPKAAA